MCRWVMSPPRRQGILFIAESSNVAQEPTSGQQGHWLGMFPEGGCLDDWMLKKRHRWDSVLSEMGQGELMGLIHCTWIPFILIAINQSHLLPLLKSYSVNPLIDPKPHFGTSTVELFFVRNSHDPLCSMFSPLSLSRSHLITPSFRDHDDPAY